MTSRCRCWLPTWRPHLNFREVRGHHPRPPQRSDHWECLCWEVWVFSNSTLGKVWFLDISLLRLGIFHHVHFWRLQVLRIFTTNCFWGPCTRWNDIPKMGQTQTDMLNQTPRCGSCVCLKIVYSISIHIPIWSTDESSFSLLRLQVWGYTSIFRQTHIPFRCKQSVKMHPIASSCWWLPWCDIHIQYDEVYNII